MSILIKKKKVIYIAIWIIFILYLISANKIIASIKDNNVTEVSTRIDELKKDTVLHSIEVNFQEGIFGSFDYIGWAFCETNFDNTNKEVWIILANDKKTYMYKNELKRRDDVFDAFKEQYKIKGSYHGISSNVSTVGVKTGIYKLYIYCKENEDNYGLVDTGIMIRKDNRGIRQYAWYSSELYSFVETISNRNVESAIDSASVTEDGFRVIGWAFVPDLDTANQSVYVRLTFDDGTKVTYDTQNISRPDVGIAYENDLYNNSGFMAVIPGDKLKGGGIKIEILVKNEGNVYLSSSSYRFSNNETGQELYKEENINKQKDVDTENIVRDDRIKHNIDSCTADKYLVISGWAFIEGMESSTTSIYIEVKSATGEIRVFDTAKITRPDVAEHFNNGLYAESGFKAVIPLDAITEGDNIITIIADNGSMSKASTSYTFTY